MSEEKIICLIATLDPSQHFPDNLKWDSKPLLKFFIACSISSEPWKYKVAMQKAAVEGIISEKYLHIKKMRLKRLLNAKFTF